MDHIPTNDIISLLLVVVAIEIAMTCILAVYGLGGCNQDMKSIYANTFKNRV